MRRRYFDVHNNSGFTLIELIIAMGIAIVVIALTLGILLSGMNHFMRTAEMTKAKSLGDAVFEMYKNRLTYASGIDLNPTEGEPSGENIHMYVENGHVMKSFYNKDNSKVEHKDVYGSEFYENMNIEIKVEIKSDVDIRLAVIVKNRKGRDIYAVDGIFRALNVKLEMDRGGGGITCGGETWNNESKITINPVVSYKNTDSK